MVPKETGNNAYVNFWRANKGYYILVFLIGANCFVAIVVS